MKLDKNYSIETDRNNWILKFRKEYTNRKREKAVGRDQWYFPNLGECLKKYVDESLKGSETVNEILVRLDNLEQTIKKVST